ncbi:MAG: hypothetical protein AAF623_20650, partial [Planctomycetota bacterium]
MIFILADSPRKQLYFGLNAHRLFLILAKNEQSWSESKAKGCPSNSFLSDMANSDENASLNPKLDNVELETLLRLSSESISAIAPLLPNLDSVNKILAKLQPAIARGYFLPDEDEEIRAVFSHYLTTRAALLSILEDLRPYALADLKNSRQRPEIFLLAFTTACLLVRTGRFLIDSFRSNKVIWRKLDESEPRFGIPRK